MHRYDLHHCPAHIRDGRRHTGRRGTRFVQQWRARQNGNFANRMGIAHQLIGIQIADVVQHRQVDAADLLQGDNIGVGLTQIVHKQSSITWLEQNVLLLKC